MADIEDEEGYHWDDSDPIGDDDEDVLEVDLDLEECSIEEALEITEELTETGESIQAIRIWREIADRLSDDPQASYHHAYACFCYLTDEADDEFEFTPESEQQAILEEGISRIEEALSSDPDNTTYINLSGMFYKNSGDLQTALDLFRLSLEANEDQEEIQVLVDQLEDQV